MIFTLSGPSMVMIVSSGIAAESSTRNPYPLSLTFAVF